MKTVWRTLYSSVVLVPLRHQSAWCSLLDSTPTSCSSNVSISQVPLNLETSRTQLSLKLSVNKLVSSFHQTTKIWLFSLMICLCPSLTLGVTRSLWKSLVNWLTTRVSTSLKKILVVSSNRLTTYNSWELWTILAVVVMTFLTDSSVSSSQSTWLLLATSQSETSMVAFSVLYSPLRDTLRMLSTWRPFSSMQLLQFGKLLESVYSQHLQSSITYSIFVNLLVSLVVFAKLPNNTNSR